MRSEPATAPGPLLQVAIGGAAIATAGVVVSAALTTTAAVAPAATAIVARRNGPAATLVPVGSERIEALQRRAQIGERARARHGRQRVEVVRRWR